RARLRFVAGCRLLPSQGAGDRIDHARELEQEAVSHQLDDTAAVPGDDGCQNLLAQKFEARDCACLVLADQARIADNIGRKNGRQPSLHRALPSGAISQPKLAAEVNGPAALTHHPAAVTSTSTPWTEVLSPMSALRPWCSTLMLARPGCSLGQAP